MTPKVSIIILNWNGWEDTIECLESIYQISYQNYDVIVVDNGSEDESIEKIKEYCEGKIKVESNFFEYSSENKPIKIIEYTREEAEAGGGKEREIENLPSNRKLIIIKNEKNYGFAEGNNIAMRYALKTLNTDYVLLLNNDTVVDKGFLDELVKVGESDEKVRVVPLNGYWNDIGYPWDYIDANMYMLERVGFAVGENTELWDSAIIRKLEVIGENCEVKNCVIEHSVIGGGCVVGEFSIVKRSVVMSHSHVPHLNYVPDSVNAEGCNLGAGTKIANLRFDDRNVKMSIKGERIDAGRRKLGAIMGYNVKTGINASIYPGVKISSGKWIEAETLVRRDI